MSPSCTASDLRQIVALLLLATGVASAHDYWIAFDPCRPAPDGEVSVLIGGGHYFPRSAIAVQDRVIRECQLTHPDGSTAAIETKTAEHDRAGRAALSAPGTYRAALVIQRPGAAEPEYTAAAIWTTSDAAPNPAAYAAGVGLEIVPRRPIEELRPDERLPLEVRQDGIPVRAQVQVLMEDGGVSWLEATPSAPALYRVKKTGRHLAIVNLEKQSCSLFFCVPP